MLVAVNAPLIFWGVWRLVNPFVAPATREKISFLAGATGRRELLAAVGSEVVPADLGGEAALVPVQVAAAQGVHLSATASRQGTSPAAKDSTGVGSGPLRRLGNAMQAAGRGVARAGVQAVVQVVARPLAAVGRQLRPARARLASSGAGAAAHSLLERAVLTQALLLGLLLRLVRATVNGARRVKALAAPYLSHCDAAAPDAQRGEALQLRATAAAVPRSFRLPDPHVS